MARNALLRSSLVGGRVWGSGGRGRAICAEGRGNAEDEEDRLGGGKSGVPGAGRGMSRLGGGEFSPLWGNCFVGLRSRPMHDFFRCFPCTFGTLLVNSVLSLYTQCFACAFIALLVHS